MQRTLPESSFLENAAGKPKGLLFGCQAKRFEDFGFDEFLVPRNVAVVFPDDLLIFADDAGKRCCTARVVQIGYL